MNKLDKLMEHKDEYIIQKILEHKGLIRQAIDSLNKPIEEDDEEGLHV